MLYILTHAAALLAFAATVWLSGAALLAVFTRSELGPWRFPARIVVGLAYWIAALFLLATLGLLRPLGLVVAGLPVVFLVTATFTKLSRSSKPDPSPDHLARPSKLDLVAGTFFLLVLGLTYGLALTPTVSWDASAYHLTVPRLYVEHGGFRPVEMNVYSNWPMAVDLLFAGALVVQDFVLAKSLELGFGLLLLASFFAAARTFAPGRRAVPWLAAAFVLANDIVAFELRVAYVDLAHAFFLFVTFLLLDRALDAENAESRRIFFLLAGLAGGLLAGVKLPGPAFVAMVVVVALPRLVRGGRKVWRTFGLVFLLPVLLLWIPWPLKAFWATGNPVYPALHGVLGGPDWSPALGERFAAWQRSIGMGREPLDYLLLPFRAILSGGRGYEHFDGRIHPAWLVLLPLAFVAWRRPEVRRLLAVAGLGFLFWGATSQQMRFLIPLLPFLALAAALGVDDLLERARRRTLWRGLALAVAMGLVLQVHAPYLVSGFKSYTAFLRLEKSDAPPILETAVPPVHRFIGEELPEDARILFVNTNQGFFSARPYLADSFFEASQIGEWLGNAASPEEVRRRLRERGITHVLIDRTPRGTPPAFLLELLGDPSRAEVLFASPDGRHVLLELR